MAVVRIITDASFCPETRASAWAAYVIAPQGRAMYGACFSSSVGGANKAELRAIEEALLQALKAGKIAEGDVVTILTDSQAVISEWKRKPSFKQRRRARLGLPWPGRHGVDTPPGTPSPSSAVSAIRLLASTNRLTLNIELLVRKTDKQHRVIHDWVDKRAYQQMCAQRKKRLAPPPGFEPRSSHSKCDILPLDEGGPSD